VTAYHFPEVTQLGDITKINVNELEPVDIVCAGSPCQDLSVAGKRAGLEGERSGLFHTAIRLVHELRARTGKPRYFVWENVPGAFSSNRGADFRAVLEEISEVEIPMPKDNKWASAGMVEWDGGSLAWRVLDAQYWGVPQRRKRIFLIADFAGLTAGEILFESKSMSGDSAQGDGEVQEATTGTGRSTNISIYDMTHHDEVICAVHGDKTQTLKARMGTGGNNTPILHVLNDQAVCVGNGQLNQVQLSDKAGALNTMHDQQCVMYRQGGFADYNADTKAGHLRASGGDLGGGSETLIVGKSDALPPGITKE
jgi:DNA (cytosine-5)-methyltransferase 1